jgi:hypothetical protein
VASHPSLVQLGAWGVPDLWSKGQRIKQSSCQGQRRGAGGRVGVWAYGRMGVTRTRTALLPDGTYETHGTNVTDPLVP